MRVVFRVDASLTVGSGHAMRCLTLATALRITGADCHFVCREHPGHLIDLIQRQGFACTALPRTASTSIATGERPYAAWLGATQAEDASQCRPLLEELHPDWLVVDHYALDACWESALRTTSQQLLAIDDLADRPHDCDVLLDQNLSCQEDAYTSLLPAHCRRLIGTHYALLRPEFAAQRAASLEHRRNTRLRHLLVSMGGVDLDNATGQVLATLPQAALPPDCRITVVMGARAPWLAQVRQQAARLSWPTEIHVDVTDMAALMTDSDLAIGASGSSAWERCCLGLPTLLVVLADNQAPIAETLANAGAGFLLGRPADITTALLPALAAADNRDWLATASQRARTLCDGQGTRRVVDIMRRLHA